LLNDSLRLYLAEFIGTFILVFVATGAVIVNDTSGGVVTHVGIAIATGLVVMVVVYSIGDVLGSHINPAVTLGFMLASRFPPSRFIQYLFAQCLGAVLASLLLAYLFSEHTNLATTVPSGPVLQSFLMELIITFIFMFIILSVSTGSMEKGIMAGSAIGAFVALAVLFAGPVSGASMNPARSLAPALVTMELSYLWIYLTAPFIGSAVAVVAFRLVHRPY
jgi:aquaporin NIP